MVDTAIAIIGMAGRFPDADDVDAFRENLRRGHESPRPLSAARIAAQALEPDARYKVMAYLDDITAFDREFFGMLPVEACTLSPNVRLLLEETWHTFESTGRTPDRFRGTRTDVYMTQTDAVYGSLADDESATLFTGNSPDFLVARVNRMFDLRGTSVVVDTACSSGLAAVLMACDALRLERADYALVCGANVYIFPYDTPAVLDTASPDGRSRSYAADANGMVPGEVAACVLLTTRARAESEGLPIHALVCGGASNNNGAMSNSPSAPHSLMQAEAMREAWQRAGVAPHDVGCVEGHGSATLLGDSLEIEALRLAFKDRGSDVAPCLLSSVKANIGHGKSAAALSSLVKAVLSVQHGEHYPVPHLRQVNPLLRKPDSPVIARGQLEPWPAERRLAAVHSYGMSGVNVHVIVENHREPARSLPAAGEWFPAPICSRRDDGLIEHVTALRDWTMAHADVPIGDVARTLSLGRQHFSRRHVLLVRDVDELARGCDAWITATADDAAGRLRASDRDARPVTAVTSPRVLLLLSHDRAAIGDLRTAVDALAARFPTFQRAMARFDLASASDGGFIVAAQLALHELYGAMGVSGPLIGVGEGRLAADVVKGTRTGAEAMREADTLIDAPIADLETRVSALIAAQAQHTPIVFLQLGRDSVVSRAIRERLDASRGRVDVVGDDAVRAIGESVARLFEAGAEIRFDPWFEGRDTRTAPLPGYRFARTRCWLRDEPRARIETPAHPVHADEPSSDRVWADSPLWDRRIAAIWREMLGHDRFGPDDRLFDRGGDSLLATRIVRRINQEFGVRCAFEDVFEAPTVAALGRLVREQCGMPVLVTLIWRDVLQLDRVDADANFFDLGGHSLVATEILLRVRHDFGIVVSFDDFFGAPTPRTFAALVESRLRARAEGNGHAPSTSRPSARERPRLTAAAWAEELRRRETT